jgi:hypothetical protein
MLTSTQVSRFLRPSTAALAALILIVAVYANAAQQLARRLILKDGSYQAITKYEVHGDRVRYYSAEREDWEELPGSLVDWPATENYAHSAASSIPEAAALDKEAASERDVADADLPHVAPGLRLPDLSGMYMLDNFKGQAQIVELQQSEGDINRNTKANILRGAIPAGGTTQTIELEGDHATTYSHVAVPSIYVRRDEEDAPPAGETASAKPSMPSLDAPRDQRQKSEQPEQREQAVVPFDQYQIVHLKVKNGKRIVGDIKRAPTGKTSQEQNSVKTTIDRVGSGWLKLTPIEDLTPGEYAVIETKGKQGMNLYVWPFSVNATAPANANPWTPKASAEAAPK